MELDTDENLQENSSSLMTDAEYTDFLNYLSTHEQHTQYDQSGMPHSQQLEQHSSEYIEPGASSQADQQLPPFGRLDSSYFSANCQLPQVVILILSQPKSLCRIRSEGEIKDFANRGSAKTIGSQLKGGAGKNDFVKISLNLTDANENQTDVVVEGELLVMLVGAEGSVTGQSKPIQVHPWNLTGQLCNADYGIYRQRLTLSANAPTSVILTKVGIVQCNKHKVQERSDQKAQMLYSFSRNSNLHSVLHDPKSELSSGPLSADPLKDAEPKLRLLFAFVPNAQSTVLNAYAVSEPITCGAGNSGGKEFKVKALNPHFVYLKDGSTRPATCDIWVQLEADVKVKSEVVTAKLLLPDATDTNLNHEVDVKVDVQRNLLKLSLTSLTADQLCMESISREQFVAELHLTKQSNAAGASSSGADTFEDTVRVVFSYIDSPPQKKPRRT